MRNTFATWIRAALALCLTSTYAEYSCAAPVTAPAVETDVNIAVLPVASLTITGSNLLYLDVPPSGSTVPSSGVSFVVSGTAHATLTAEPNAFMEVASDTPGVDEVVGKAVLNSGAIGYRLELRFPRTGVVGSPAKTAVLPGYEAGPTTPPLTVNLMSTGGQRSGVLHMESDPAWTPDGGMPLPGVYVGEVVLTLIAD